MNDKFGNIKKEVKTSKTTINEIAYLMNQLKGAKSSGEKDMINSQIKELKKSLADSNETSSKNVGGINVIQPLVAAKEATPTYQIKKAIMQDLDVPREKRKKYEIPKNLSLLEKDAIKRLKVKKKEGKKKKKSTKPSVYINLSNRLFSKISKRLIENKNFIKLERNLARSKIEIVPASYISILFFTLLVGAGIGLVLFLFFLFFNIEVTLPIITKSIDTLGVRLAKVFWLIFVTPIVAFFIAYIYPSLEEKSLGGQMDQELPFATIHMSAISGSMLDPSKIFSIIIATKEYPHLEKEFIRLMNQINLYGYDLVTALKSTAYNSPSKRLSELLTGLATTIGSGGNLQDFFDKRSQTLLFDYRIDREKYAKSAETMMDIYISVVLAAPMIFMLLMMMMKISGLGISMAIGTITLMTILAVLLINLIFLSFLHLKQPSG